MFLISSSTTSIIFRTWWVVGIVFGTENINYLAKLLDWLIRNGWLNTFRSRGGIGYLQRRVKPYVLRKRLCAMSLCRCDVIYGGSRGNWRFLSAKLDYLCYAIFRPSVCFLDATILMFSAILTVVWKRFSLIDMCWLTPEARTVLSWSGREEQRLWSPWYKPVNIILGRRRAPAPTWAASSGPEDDNLEVKLYWDKLYGMLVQEMENISGSKARSVARTASIEIETSDTSTVWDACYSSRSSALFIWGLIMEKLAKCIFYINLKEFKSWWRWWWWSSSSFLTRRSLYSSTRINPIFHGSWRLMIWSLCCSVFLRKRGPAAYMGGFGGARKSQLGGIPGYYQ